MVPPPSVPPPPNSPPPNPPDPKELERFGYWVRFGFGFVVGLLLALGFGLVDLSGSLGGIALGLAVVALIIGGLSAHLGEPFWRFLARVCRWF